MPEQLPKPRSTARLRMTYGGALLICLAIAAIWIASFHHYWHGFGYVSNRGIMLGATIAGSGDDNARNRGFLVTWGLFGATDARPLISDLNLKRWGFGLRNTRGPSDDYGVVFCPYWFIQLAAITLLFAAWRPLYVRSIRKRRCLCLQCGYDLRATPDRCPECGSPAIPAAKFQQRIPL